MGIKIKTICKTSEANIKLLPLLELLFFFVQKSLPFEKLPFLLYQTRGVVPLSFYLQSSGGQHPTKIHDYIKYIIFTYFHKYRLTFTIKKRQ